VVVRRFVECANVSVDRTHEECGRQMAARFYGGPENCPRLTTRASEGALVLSGVRADLFYRLP
jgi:hypothetical protein